LSIHPRKYLWSSVMVTMRGSPSPPSTMEKFCVQLWSSIPVVYDVQ
jgi:hypothetical protein